MSGVWERVSSSRETPAALRRTGVAVDHVMSRLEAGTAPADLITSLDLTPADLISILGHAALGDDQSEGVELTQSRPLRPWLEPSLSDATWQRLIPAAPRPALLGLAAGLLQIHDFWEASHEAAQEAGDLGERLVSAYWHGIAHRREPDAGNASYWFRRVGRHSLFSSLATSARDLLVASDQIQLSNRLFTENIWNPSAFIDLCSNGRPAPQLAPIIRKLQRLEMIALLDTTASAVLPS